MPLELKGPNSAGFDSLNVVPGHASPDLQDASMPYLGEDETVIAAVVNPLVAAVSGAIIPPAANVPALSLIDDTLLANGALVWVTSRKRYFSLDKTSSAALTSGEVVATKSGTGRWVSLDATTSFVWSLQTVWYLDPANASNAASDDNNGLTAGTPLLTGEELQRRLGTLQRTLNGGSTVTVNVLSSGANLSFMGVKGTINVVGTRTQIFAGTLTSATAINRAGNTPQIIQASGLAGSWTALGGVSQRIRLTSGATLGTAFIMVDDGTGNHQAETTPFVDSSGNSFNPAGTENFVVESLSTIADITMDQVGVLELIVFVTDSQFTTLTKANAGQVIANGCKFAGQIWCLNSLTVTGCFLGGVSSSYSGSNILFVHACGVTADIRTGFPFGSKELGALATINVDQDTFMLDAEIFVYSPESNQIGPVFFKNTTKKLIDTSIGASAQTQGGAFQCTGILYGSTTLAASVGVLLGKGARVDLNGFTATFTSPGNNWQFGSAGKAHAGLPFVDQFNVGAGAVANSNMAQAI